MNVFGSSTAGGSDLSTDVAANTAAIALINGGVSGYVFQTSQPAVTASSTPAKLPGLTKTGLPVGWYLFTVKMRAGAATSQGFIASRLLKNDVVVTDSVNLSTILASSSDNVFTMTYNVQITATTDVIDFSYYGWSGTFPTNYVMYMDAREKHYVMATLY